MTPLEPAFPLKSRSFDWEVLTLVVFFVAFWLTVAAVAYYVSPIIGCLSDLPSNKTATCTRALEIRFVPSILRRSLRSKLISSLMQESAYENALKQIAIHEEDGPLGYSMLMERGSAFKYSGKTDEAIKAYRAALAMNPSSEDPVTELFQVMLDAKQFEGARLEAQTFLQANPNSVNIISWQGWIEHRAGNTAAGIVFYKDAIKIKPDETYLYRDLAYLEKMLGQSETAIATLTTALKFNPEDASLYSRRAELFTEMGQHDKAQNDLEAVLKLYGTPRDVDALVELGRSYTTTSDFDKAASLLAEALAQSNTHEYAHASKIRMFYLQDKFDLAQKAIEDLRKAVPDSTEAIYWDASLADKQGRPAEALTGYQKVLQTWAEDASVLSDIGHVLIDLDRTPESFVYFDRAIKAKPKADYAFAGRARAHNFMKNWTAAEADSTTSIELNPNQAMSFARRAWARVHLGNITGAASDYEVASQSDLKLEWLQREYLEFLLANDKTDDAKKVLARLQGIPQLEPLVSEFRRTLNLKGKGNP